MSAVRVGRGVAVGLGDRLPNHEAVAAADRVRVRDRDRERVAAGETVGMLAVIEHETPLLMLPSLSIA
jgi:hypothetical protein